MQNFSEGKGSPRPDYDTPVYWATAARCIPSAAARFSLQKSTLALQRPICFHQLLVLRFPKLPLEPEAVSGIYGAAWWAAISEP